MARRCEGCKGVEPDVAFKVRVHPGSGRTWRRHLCDDCWRARERVRDRARYPSRPRRIRGEQQQDDRRVCKACGRRKPLDCFARRRHAGQGTCWIEGRCKVCQRIWRRERSKGRARPGREPWAGKDDWQAEYVRTPLGSKIVERVNARARLRHWQARVEQLDRQIERLRGG